MPSSFALGEHFESLIRSLVSSGRYNNASEVVRDALRGLEDREKERALDQAELDAFLSRSMDDIDAGRLQTPDQLRERLRRRRSERQAAAE